MYACRMVSFVEKYPQASENIMTQYVSKHFYLEKVFDDLSTDGPKQVWRYKNFFGDGASTSQKTNQSGSYSENIDLQPKPITVSSQFTQPRAFPSRPVLLVPLSGCGLCKYIIVIN